MSPARIGGHPNQHGNHHPPRQPPALQATDFPPLSSGPEKKVAPVAGGAWTNSSMRSVLTSVNNVSGASGNALVHYPVTQSPPAINNGRSDDMEPGFERPPPRSNAELFNPKAPAKRSTVSRGNSYPGTPDEKLGDVGKANDGVRVDNTVHDAVTNKLAGLDLNDRVEPAFVNEPDSIPDVNKAPGDGSSSA